jgi:neutral ceramidase
VALLAGFAEADITPPIGTLKIGWLVNIVSEYVMDPICARVAVLESDTGRIAVVQLDTLSVRWSHVDDIRKRVEAQYGFPGANIMVSATHSHAGPAVANCGDVPRDQAYIETVTRKVVECFGRALDDRQEAQVGFGSVAEFEVGRNRRVVMRDGTVRTHGNFNEPDALFLEGPIDPEVAVIAARDREGKLLGALVNFACHPTAHGPDGALTAGYPGVVAAKMRDGGCPVTLYLNGACGNLHTADPTRGGVDTPMEEAGAKLAADALGVIAEMTFRDEVRLGSASRTLQLPYREPTDEQTKGTVHGAQRFISNDAYEQHIPALLERIRERIRERGTQPAEVQVHFLGEYALAAIPAEYFVENGLRIKEQANPRHALVTACSNGMIGYVPHRQAFDRGGYETTFMATSRMAPEAGEMLAACAIELIREDGTT